MTEESTRELGNFAAKRGDWKEALRLYSQAIVANPRDAHAWCNRALAHLKLDQLLLAWGDGLHVLDSLDANSVKAFVRIGMAYDGMQLYDRSELAYATCLKMSLDEASRRDIQERLQKATAARKRKADEEMEKLESLKLHEGAHRLAAMDAAAEKQPVQRFLSSGIATLPSALRSGEGGPRHPAAVTAAFGKSLSTDWIALKDVGPKGVGIVAVREIPAGEVIHIDKPFLATSLQGERPAGVKDCDHCTRPITAASAARCSCDRVFCSLECKATAMALYHAPLCSMGEGKAVTKLEASISAGSSASSRFILTMWKMLGCAMMHSAATGEPLMSPPDAPLLCHLARRSDLASADGGAPGAQMTAAYVIRTHNLIRSVLSKPLVMEPALSVRWICDALTMLSTNVLGLSGTGWPSVAQCGQVLMSAGSFFNHSCVPNTLDTSNSDVAGSLVRFETARSVKEGEELTIGYCDVDAPFEARQLTLSSQYGFDCACAKCKAEGSA